MGCRAHDIAARMVCGGVERVNKPGPHKCKTIVSFLMHVHVNGKLGTSERMDLVNRQHISWLTFANLPNNRANIFTASRPTRFRLKKADVLLIYTSDTLTRYYNMTVVTLRRQSDVLGQQLGLPDLTGLPPQTTFSQPNLVIWWGQGMHTDSAITNQSGKTVGVDAINGFSSVHETHKIWDLNVGDSIEVLVGAPMNSMERGQCMVCVEWEYS